MHLRFVFMCSILRTIMSNATQFLALICVVLLVSVQAAKEVPLPSSIRICDSKLPNYPTCLKNTLQESWPTIVKGIPELDIPPLDPLVLDKVKEEFQLGSMESSVVARDVKIIGFANTTFLAVRPSRSADRMTIEIDAAVPYFFTEGYYKIEGRVGSMKIGGKGYFNATSEGNRATWRLEGRIENDRWVLEHVRSLPEGMNIDKFKVYFDDLFNGNKELTRAAMSFMNEFWPMLYKTMHPLMEKQMDARITALLNDVVFSKLSVAKTFP